MTKYKAVALMHHTDGPIGEDLKVLVCQVSVLVYPCYILMSYWVVRGALDRRNDKALCQTGEAYFGEHPSFPAQFLSLSSFTFRANRSAIYHTLTLLTTITHLKTRNVFHVSRTRGKLS
jgi:hypothetical protein